MKRTLSRPVEREVILECLAIAQQAPTASNMQNWTCLHLFFEEEAAQVLGIPYAEVMQACLIPVAYTQGTRFKPAWREPLDTIIHWETW